jgi:hypothetical protein
MYLSPLDYMSMVMVFLSSNLKGLIHIHSLVDNCLKVCLIKRLLGGRSLDQDPPRGPPFDQLVGFYEW